MWFCWAESQWSRSSDWVGWEAGQYIPLLHVCPCQKKPRPCKHWHTKNSALESQFNKDFRKEGNTQTQGARQGHQSSFLKVQRKCHRKPRVSIFFSMLLPRQPIRARFCSPLYLGSAQPLRVALTTVLEELHNTAALLLGTQEWDQLQHPRHKIHYPTYAFWDSKSLSVEFRGSTVGYALSTCNHLTRAQGMLWTHKRKAKRKVHTVRARKRSLSPPLLIFPQS